MGKLLWIILLAIIGVAAFWITTKQNDFQTEKNLEESRLEWLDIVRKEFWRCQGSLEPEQKVICESLCNSGDTKYCENFDCKTLEQFCIEAKNKGLKCCEIK